VAEDFTDCVILPAFPLAIGMNQASALLRARFVALSALVVTAFTLAVRADMQIPAAQTAARTTKTGVYTTAQAARGEETYMLACVSCHPPGAHKGGAFLEWQGYTLDKLVGFLTDSMPENEPGSLTPKEYTQVVAYLLKTNGMPAGQDELPTDLAQLRAITIDFSPGRLTPSHH